MFSTSACVHNCKVSIWKWSLLELLCIASGVLKWCSRREEWYVRSSKKKKKIKHRITIWSRNSTSGYIPKRTESEGLSWYLYTSVHSSVIQNSQKVETAQMSTDRWMDKQNVYIHTLEYYSALKREEILTHATVWMDLQDSMRSEISQAQKEKHCMILFFFNKK